MFIYFKGFAAALDEPLLNTPINLELKGTTPNNSCNNCRYSLGRNGEYIEECTKMDCNAIAKNKERKIIAQIAEIALHKKLHDEELKRREVRQVKQTAPSEQIYTQAEHDSPNFTCTPSQSFKIQCNTCWCAADGKSARFCTKFPCTKTV